MSFPSLWGGISMIVKGNSLIVRRHLIDCVGGWDTYLDSCNEMPHPNQWDASYQSIRCLLPINELPFPINDMPPHNQWIAPHNQLPISKMLPPNQWDASSQSARCLLPIMRCLPHNQWDASSHAMLSLLPCNDKPLPINEMPSPMQWDGFPYYGFLHALYYLLRPCCLSLCKIYGCFIFLP